MQYLTIRPMNWKPHLPEIFLGISLGMIALEAALTRVAIIKARYLARDTFASLGVQTVNAIRIAFHEWAATHFEEYPRRLGGSSWLNAS